jgi:signal transduction histidine kinase
MNRMTQANWNDLLGEVAHDLKTPLTAVKGFIELVQASGELNERQQHFSERALASLEHMQRLVSQLTEITRLEQPLEAQECDLSTVVSNAVEMLNETAAQHSIKLHTDITPDVGKIRAQPHQVDQVVLNLLSNAIKYNRAEGEVWVRAEGSESTVRVSIRDTGRGIPSEDQPHVFERFFRSQANSRTNPEGSGLGLAIVKAIIERHHGTIWLESTPDEGSTFTFILPRDPDNYQHHSATGEMPRAVSYNAESSDEVTDSLSSETDDPVDDDAQEAQERDLSDAGYSDR